MSIGNRVLGLGIIGGGGAFGRFISTALPLVRGVEVRAIAGSNEDRTRRAAVDLNLSQWTINYQELVNDPRVDVVVIASPPFLHAEMALAAARAGKAIFLEKPVATRLDDALALLAATRERRVPVGVDYVMRYSPLYQLAQQIVLEGLLGAPRRVEFRNDAGDEGLDAGHWFWDRDRSGGIFIEHGVHFFDVYGWLIGGMPETVRGLTLERDGTSQQDVVHADVLYRNGVLGVFTHAFDKPSRLEAQEGYLVLDRGAIRISGWTPTRLELEGIVSDQDAQRLAHLPGLTMESAHRLSGAQRSMRGKGQAYVVDQHVRAAYAPPEDSQELYRRAVAAALNDLVATVRDPGHRQLVTLEDGVTSLAVACVAAGVAGQADLRGAIAAAHARVA